MAFRRVAAFLLQVSSQEDVIVHFLQAFIEALQILSVFRKRDAGFQLEEYHLAGTDGVSGKITLWV